MAFFTVVTVHETGGQTVDLAHTDISIKWKSGGGSMLDTTTGRTDGNGIAKMMTPAVWLIPTGAEGVITTSNGSYRGRGTVSVDFWGNPVPKHQRIMMHRDTEGSIKDLAKKAGGTAKDAAILLIAVLAVTAVIVVGIRRYI
jgi:hypothetical protein